MFALYGTQRQYLSATLAHGITRESSAFFLLPERLDPDRLEATLMCAVYHAAGLRLLGEAIRGRVPLSVLLERDGLCFILFQTELEACPHSFYRCLNRRTYPYVKVRNCGDIRMKWHTVLFLPPKGWNTRIDAPGAGNVLRFFQKDNGREQWLPDCDMDALRGFCQAAANTLKEQIRREMERIT